MANKSHNINTQTTIVHAGGGFFRSLFNSVGGTIGCCIGILIILGIIGIIIGLGNAGN